MSRKFAIIFLSVFFFTLLANSFAMAGVTEPGGGGGPTPTPGAIDTDGDGWVDSIDKCRTTHGFLEGCPDVDGDGLANPYPDPAKLDNCPNVWGPISNGGCPVPTPAPDADGDGLPDSQDQCPLAGPNHINGCPDTDGDGIPNHQDNCATVYNAGQADNDGDGAGNSCDPDDDNDGIQDPADNCPNNANADQKDRDGDGLGNVCDPDDDNDGVLDGDDNCIRIENANQTDSDHDGMGNACDDDDDNDIFPDNEDNCPTTFNPPQANTDGDSMGNACDTDDDNDTVIDLNDLCPLVAGDPANRGCIVEVITFTQTCSAIYNVGPMNNMPPQVQTSTGTVTVDVAGTVSGEFTVSLVATVDKATGNVLYYNQPALTISRAFAGSGFDGPFAPNNWYITGVSLDGWDSRLVNGAIEEDGFNINFKVKHGSTSGTVFSHNTYCYFSSLSLKRGRNFPFASGAFPGINWPTSLIPQ